MSSAPIFTRPAYRRISVSEEHTVARGQLCSRLRLTTCQCPQHLRMFQSLSTIKSHQNLLMELISLKNSSSLTDQRSVSMCLAFMFTGLHESELLHFDTHQRSRTTFQPLLVKL